MVRSHGLNLLYVSKVRLHAAKTAECGEITVMNKEESNGTFL